MRKENIDSSKTDPVKKCHMHLVTNETSSNVDHDSQKNHAMQLLQDIFKALESDTVNSVVNAYDQSMERLINWNFQYLSDKQKMTQNEAKDNTLTNMQKIKPVFEKWLTERLQDRISPYYSINTENIDSICNIGLEGLISANDQELALHNELQDSIHAAIQRFKLMLYRSGYRSEHDLRGLPFSKMLFRCNPVNIIKLMTPIVNKLSRENRDIEWLLYRMFNLQVMLALPNLYEQWEAKLKQTLPPSPPERVQNSDVHQ